MPSRTDQSRSNLKAGIFVCVGILLAFTVVAILGDVGRFLRPRAEYTLRFDLDAGVDGLVPGSVVKVGGLDSGRVVSVQPQRDGKELLGALVQIELDGGFALFDNARVTRTQTLLGGNAAVSFSDLGSAEGGTLVPKGGTLDVHSVGGGALRTLVGEANAERIGEIIENLNVTLASIKQDYASTISPALQRVDQITADARDVVASLKSDYGGWRERVSSTLGNVDVASQKLPPLLDDGKTLVADLRGATEKVSSLLDANRPAIDEMVVNLRAASGDVKAIVERVRTQMLDRVDGILVQANRGIESYIAVADRLRAEIDTLAPPLETALADARLTAQQLKLASIEVRRSPWRLLYRPSEKELENEMLYDAARSFALAAGDLQSTAETVDRVLTKNAELLRADPAMADRLRNLLTGSLERYEQVQKQLFGIITSEP